MKIQKFYKKDVELRNTDYSFMGNGPDGMLVKVSGNVRLIKRKANLFIILSKDN